MKRIVSLLLFGLISASSFSQLLPAPVCNDKPWCYVGIINAGDMVYFNEHIDRTALNQPETWWRFKPPVPRYLDGELFDEMLILIRSYCKERQTEVLAMGINLNNKSVAYAVLGENERKRLSAPNNGIGALQVDIPCATERARNQGK